jgi:hypothetical protein
MCRVGIAHFTIESKFFQWNTNHVSFSLDMNKQLISLVLLAIFTTPIAFAPSAQADYSGQDPQSTKCSEDGREIASTSGGILLKYWLRWLPATRSKNSTNVFNKMQC